MLASLPFGVDASFCSAHDLVSVWWALCTEVAFPGLTLQDLMDMLIARDGVVLPEEDIKTIFVQLVAAMYYVRQLSPNHALRN